MRIALRASENRMSPTLEALEAEVLRLSASDRSNLLDRLIASLDADKALAQAWDREAERRDAEIENGISSAVAGKEVLARLRTRIR